MNSLDGKTKNEIDYIITAREDTIKDVTVINRLKGSDH